MSEGKVLQISPDEAKYLDPNQIASIQMLDGTTILVQGNQGGEEFVEEAQPDEQQYQTQENQQGEQPKLRGRGGAVLGALAGAALLGTAAAIGGGIGMRRPYGYRPMVPPPPPMMMGPRPPMMMGPRPPMMRGPRHMGRGFF